MVKRTCRGAIAAAVMCAAAPFTQAADAPTSMVAELAAVIALHGWPCDGITQVEPAEGRWVAVTCRAGEVYDVMVRDDWDWRALERQTRLLPMIEIGKQTRQLAAEDAVSRRRAIAALADLGPDAAPAAPALAAALEDDNPFVREAAAGALGKIGPGAAAALSALTAALDDPDRGVRRSAADALAAIRGP